uniref:Family with sequence similarity 83 member C n=1 Tax=Fundulus heteroclitus TaxID=8078 RepID=A0A3Q2PR38_FUNHE
MFRRSGKPLGKLASRLEEVKNPWREGSKLELSHNEAARLATDALLEQGEKEYRRVLAEERELSFLSPLEIRYISQHAASKTPDPDCSNDRDDGDADAVSELTSGTYFPMMSDDEPPMLELGWPETPSRFGPSETQIFFQRDKTNNIKDTIRSMIDKAKKVIAVVMDIFTDVDLMCDLMEASNKRRVPVYILLDEKNVSYFVDMCAALDIQSSHLNNLRVRTVCGDTYCTRGGKKFTGQVLEKFMIIDCEEVIAGSYSFTWLSSQVHSNLMMHFTGAITDSFDREFRCLYADSQIIDRFNPEDEEMPYYPSVLVPRLNQFFGSRRDRSCSENSSSHSSNSVSSIKVAPGMTQNGVFRVTQGHEKEPPSQARQSPERRSGGGLRVGGPAPPMHSSPNGGTGHGPLTDRQLPSYVPLPGPDWTSHTPSELFRSNIGGTSAKFQGLGLYDHKPSLFQSTTPSAVNDPQLTPKQRTPNQFLNKMSDKFMPFSYKDKETYNFRKPPSPLNSSAWGGHELSQPEPESKQQPPPPAPMSPPGIMNRQDQKRMTLGHSKLDLVNHYNKLKSKQVYSRFELNGKNWNT